MNEFEAQQVMRIVSGLSKVFRIELEMETIAEYTSVLSDYKLEDIIRAKEHIVRTSRWMPSPSEMLDIVEQHYVAEENTIVMSKEEIQAFLRAKDSDEDHEV